jgi:hypothetical protein
MCRSRIGGSEAIIDFEPVEMCRSRIGGSEAIIDFEPEESFDDEDHDSADGTESRITQYATQASSTHAATGGRNET